VTMDLKMLLLCTEKQAGFYISFELLVHFII